MFGYFHPKIGKKRNHSRIQFENRVLAQAGFEPGTTFTRTVDLDARTITLTLSPDGTSKVHSRTVSNMRVPKIDLFGPEIADLFPGCEKARVRVYKGRIVIDLAKADRRRLSALERLKRGLARRRVKKGGLFTGGGVSERALAEGIETAGLMVRHEFVFERDQNNLAVAQKNSPAMDPTTRVVVADIDDFEDDMVGPVDILSVSMPCVGHSNSGRVKNKIRCAEEHPDAGNVVIGTLRAIEVSAAAVVVLENSEKFDNSITARMVDRHLARLGYAVEKFRLDESHCGTIERRVRSIWVAHLGVLASDRLRTILESQVDNRLSIGDIVERDRAHTWSTMDYLVAKQQRDAQRGCRFKMQTVTEDDRHLGTLGAGYHKVRSTEPKLCHPTEKGLLRQFTALEHARAKGVPDDHVRGLSNTRAHTILGNSVLYPLFVKIGMAIIRSIDANKVVEAVPAVEAPNKPSQLCFS